MKILVIEDSLFLRRAIESALQKNGHQVKTVADGELGLDAARTAPPDVILLDMMLPALEGTGVLKELKRDAATAGIPIVVLSSLSQKNEEKLLAAGATAYIQKSDLDLSTNADRLLAIVDKVARKEVGEFAG